MQSQTSDMARRNIQALFSHRPGSCVFLNSQFGPDIDSQDITQYDMIFELVESDDSITFYYFPMTGF